MDKPIIEAKNLGKRYLIGERQPYLALRDSMAELLKKPFRLFQKHEPSHPGQNEFWALKDVNFQIQKGETVGIIGRNGAGKSTLLKILSQITPPTTGSIHLRGRMASLLEVGTGFHPELTGRENIYLNGALLGMKKHEIKQKFDQIIEFADISKFLDTPVKRYSSGMYVRLAFSVAAHLEPDILVVDEVLAVGDAEFQKKCLGKMEEVTGKQGRTILFVSHNMAAIERLCSKSILLKDGQIKAHGKTPDIINQYLSEHKKEQENTIWENKDNKIYNQYFNPEKIYLTDENGKIITSHIRNDKPVWFCVKAKIEELTRQLFIGYIVYDDNGTAIYQSYQIDTDEPSWPKFKTGQNIIRSQIPAHFLNEGKYRIELNAGLRDIKWLFEPRTNTPNINMEINGGLSESPYWTYRRSGFVAPIFRWEIV
jgi:lipopolysaccharide transport system ATP-binding protein